MPDVPASEILLTSEQMACLASPLRAALLDGLLMHGPASVSELTARLKAAPKTLYYHLKQMQGAGLVQVAEVRRKGSREEALYRAAAPRIRMDTGKGAEYRAHMARSVSALCRLIDREHQQFLQTGDGALEADALVQRVVVNLPADKRPAFFALLHEAMRYARENSVDEKETRYAFTLFAIPLLSEEGT